MRPIVAWGLLGGLFGAPTFVPAAICTVTSVRVLVNNPNGFKANVPVGGLELPVTVDQSTGQFTLDLSGFPNTHFSISGVDNELDFPASVVSGTIDAAGEVTIPNMEMDFVTHFGGDTTPVTVSPLTITTGMELKSVGDANFYTEGSALDFSGGALTLSGHGLVLFAPGIGTPVASGFALQCVLAPTPDASTLPRGAVLTHAGGKGKLGKVPAPTDAEVEGDTLTLKATLTQGAQLLDPATSDVFLRVRNKDGVSVAVVIVKAATLVAKGKGLSASDSDGSKLQIATGRKNNGAVFAVPSGSLSLKRTKKGFKVAFKQTGLDLRSLAAGAGTVTLSIGTAAASDPVTVSVSKKGTKLTLR